jgi:hypothetical protein
MTERIRLATIQGVGCEYDITTDESFESFSVTVPAPFTPALPNHPRFDRLLGATKPSIDTNPLVADLGSFESFGEAAVFVIGEIVVDLADNTTANESDAARAATESLRVLSAQLQARIDEQQSRLVDAELGSESAR